MTILERFFSATWIGIAVLQAACVVALGHAALRSDDRRRTVRLVLLQGAALAAASAAAWVYELLEPGGLGTATHGRPNRVPLHFDFPALWTLGLAPVHLACVMLVLRGDSAARRLYAWTLAAIVVPGILGMAVGLAFAGHAWPWLGVLFGALAACVAPVGAFLVVAGAAMTRPRCAAVLLPGIAVAASILVARAQYGGPSPLHDSAAGSLGVGVAATCVFGLVMLRAWRAD